jgi:adhesin transport system membrane fusion protein
MGSVNTTSRIQIVQSVDGGVLSDVMVSEGDIVEEGQVLARFDQTRFIAQTNEIRARVMALQARVDRLRGEVSSSLPKFSAQVLADKELVDLELTVYRSRIANLQSQLASQEELVSIVEAETKILRELYNTGDISQAEYLTSERSLIEAQARLEAIQGDFLEKSARELAEAQDQLAQNLEVLLQREAVLTASTVEANIAGQVTNIAISTRGAVIQPGEELMRIVPKDSDLFVEVKIAPTDIADVELGDEARLQFDAYDPSVFGSVTGEVIFVSGDVINEKGQMGQEEPVYIAHVSLAGQKVITSIGHEVQLIPGMTAQVDVQAGARTVLQYLLKPIIKTLSNSLSEK